MKHARTPKGFTIVELVTVLLITSILSIYVGSKLFSTKSFQAVYFYNDVLSSFRYAQKLALTSGCHIQVSLTSTTLTLNKRASCTTGTFTTAVRDPSSGASTYVQTAPGTITMSFSDTLLYFDSLGKCHRSSDASIASYTVTVNGKTMNIVGQTGFTYDPST